MYAHTQTVINNNNTINNQHKNCISYSDWYPEVQADDGLNKGPKPVT